uniref:Uncharacterized protein n=1 Tax=Alteromonas phage ZP6 TaxID=2492447 RepID=A0A7D7KGM1_9CAUD
MSRGTGNGHKNAAGVNPGGIARAYGNIAANFAGWTDDGQGVFNETIDEIIVWKDQIPEGWS